PLEACKICLNLLYDGNQLELLNNNNSHNNNDEDRSSLV
ncbi:unnamed protein product, partial [Rotaria sp. Silwood2]